jgi:hypothetical protein
MQLNIHVPKERETVVADLEAEAAASGKAKNQIVLDALVAYLRPRRPRSKPRLRSWDLGATGEMHRADLYDERLDTAQGPAPE